MGGLPAACCVRSSTRRRDAGRGGRADCGGWTALTWPARVVLHRLRRQPLRSAALLRSDRATEPAGAGQARGRRQRSRRGDRRGGGAAAVDAPPLPAGSGRGACGGLPREPLHGARAQALSPDSSLGALCTASAAAADDVVGMEGNAAMTALAREMARDAAIFA